jgi:hypothetical protein
MAWPWIALIAKNVPWMELARRAPAILARSRELLEEAKARPPSAAASDGDALVRRLEALESRDAEHARLIGAMVDQLADLTEGMQVLTARNRLLAALVAVLLVLQVITFIAAVP